MSTRGNSTYLLVDDFKSIVFQVSFQPLRRPRRRVDEEWT